MVIERDALGFDAPAPLGHPARKGLPAGFSPGLALGDIAPNFTLPDAFGRSVSLHEHREGSPAAIVFFWSIVW